MHTQHDPLNMESDANPTIPSSALADEWCTIKSETLRRIQRVFEHGMFVMGPEVAEFEQQLARDIQVDHAITCSSGTMALQIALMALDLEPGDEVILPAFTFAAPLEVVLLLGLKAMLADVDPLTCTIDCNSVASLIGPRTRAIIAVSLYGNPADFDRLNALAEQHGVSLIEDAAQSYGAVFKGRRSGNLCTMGCTSFFPTKPLGGAGDGGALFTNDSVLAQRMRQIRDHGQLHKYHHVRLGINGRLDSISCAALIVKFGVFATLIAQRQAVARRYDMLLREMERRGQVQLPVVHPTVQSAYAQYCVQVEARDGIAAAMLEAKVQVAVHYPNPLHLQPAFKGRVFFHALENAEGVAKRVLCLPIHPTLTIPQQERVVAVLAGSL